MQTKTLIASLLAATIGVNGLPSDLAKRQTTVTDVNLYSDNGCGTFENSFGVANVTTCQVIIPAAISAEVPSLPAGCTLTFYSNSECSSTNFITVPGSSQIGQCFTFGGVQGFASVRASGTC